MRPGKPRGPAGTRRAGGVNIVHVVNFFAMTVGGARALSLIREESRITKRTTLSPYNRDI